MKVVRWLFKPLYSPVDLFLYTIVAFLYYGETISPLGLVFLSVVIFIFTDLVSGKLLKGEREE